MPRRIIKPNLKSWMFELCIAAPALYSILCCFSENFAHKLVIVVMIMGYFLLNQNYLRKGKKCSFIAFNSILLTYVIYISLVENITSIIHVYFYSYILLFVMFLLFLDEDIRNDFYTYFIKRRRRFAGYIFLCFMSIVYSILFLDGLRIGYNINLPVLYGQFGIPHVLAYIMLVVYAGAALCAKKSNSRYWTFARIVAVFCIVWSAVRSAAIAVAILIVTDVFSVKQHSKRAVIILSGIIILIIIAINTNILINNPLIQKTDYAANVAGTITNGREWYVDAVLSYYNNSTNFLQKILGSGMNAVVESIYIALGVRIQAHNDYVNILGGYGAVGLLMFIITQLKFLRLSQSVLNKFMLQAFIFVLAYFNGLAMYIMLTVSLPVVLCFFDKK